MSITTKVNVWLGNVLEAQLKSAEEERGEVGEAVLDKIGGHYGE